MPQNKSIVKNQNIISMKLLFTLMSLFFVICVGYTQEQPSNRDKAYEHLSKFQYARAIPLLLKLVDRKKPRLEDLEQLAQSYYLTNDYEQAANWYTRVTEHPESPAENLLHYAKSLKQTHQYKKAIKALVDYTERTGNTDDIALELEGSKKALEWLANPRPLELYNETNINTPRSEFSVHPTQNGVYYTGEPLKGKGNYGWTGSSYLQVYQAELDETGHIIDSSPIKNEPNPNSRYHIGPVSSNKNGDTMFVTRTYVGNKPNKEPENGIKYMTHRLELLIYNKDAAGSWKKTSFPFNNIKEYSVGHAVLAPGEKSLYFISNQPGGFGGTDIWFSELQENGQWGKPINAGSTINSEGNEMFPSFGSDGFLYYSSDGHPGMGGLDVFQSNKIETGWTEPKNLQHPINSGGDDFSYITWNDSNGVTRTFMASNRSGGKGNDDIYSLEANDGRRLVLDGVTYMGQTTEKTLSGVAVTLYDGERTLMAKTQSGMEGAFHFEIDPERTYKILGQKKGFYSDSLTLSNIGILRDTLRTTLHLEPMFEVGKKIVLEDIHYDFDKFDIRRDAAHVLNELARILRDHPSLTIELSSHTDSRGKSNYNMKLSEKRAKSAVDYLVSRGISRNRLFAKGYGESQLLNNCPDHALCTEEEHQANRRTEIKVLAY